MSIDFDEEITRLQIALIFTTCQLDALQEVVAELKAEFRGQSLDSWVDRRQGELVERSLRNIEDVSPGHSARAQALIDETKAKLAMKRKSNE